jgi:hypothetical protein
MVSPKLPRKRLYMWLSVRVKRAKVRHTPAKTSSSGKWGEQCLPEEAA